MATLCKAAVAEETPETTADQIVELKKRVRSLRAQRGLERVSSFSLPETELTPRPNHVGFPIYVVAVDKAIIPDHTKIDKKPFIRFLAQFLLIFTPDEPQKP